MLREEAKKIITERSALSVNDLRIPVYWEKLTELLARDEKATLNYLNFCNEDEMLWISEVFEDVALQLKSKEYIECLKKIDIKYPNLKLTRHIKIAEDWSLFD